MFFSCCFAFSSGDVIICLWSKPDDQQFLELHAQILKDYKKLPGIVCFIPGACYDILHKFTRPHAVNTEASKGFFYCFADTVYKLHVCDACGWVGEGFKKCAQCLRVYFCSNVCQRRAWPQHKLRCEANHKIPAAVSKVATSTPSANGSVGDDDADDVDYWESVKSALANKLAKAEFGDKNSHRFRHKQHRRRKKSSTTKLE